MNSIIAIHPYKANGMWVFDDPAVGLRQEPFVCGGADTIIDRMVADLPEAERGFALLSGFEWRRAQAGGNWYYSPDAGMKPWLCPALLKYFDSAPRRIHAQFRPKGARS